MILTGEGRGNKSLGDFFQEVNNIVISESAKIYGAFCKSDISQNKI